jgi:hypothetical protein
MRSHPHSPLCDRIPIPRVRSPLQKCDRIPIPYDALAKRRQARFAPQAATVKLIEYINHKRANR